jgi:hypothetical protein
MRVLIETMHFLFERQALPGLLKVIWFTKFFRVNIIEILKFITQRNFYEVENVPFSGNKRE